MAERVLSVDHSTVHRWVLRYRPLLLEVFRQRKRPVLSKWHVDETYIKTKGQDVYLYRVIDKGGGNGGFHVFTDPKSQEYQTVLSPGDEATPPAGAGPIDGS